MYNHLHKRVNDCPAEKDDIKLTDEIKAKILTNRRYIIPIQARVQDANTTQTIKRIGKSKQGYVYIVHIREFIHKNEYTYKIGRTGQVDPCDRAISGYTKGSIVELILRTPNSFELEKKIIQLFKRKYNQKTEYGKEYFNGDLTDMIDDIVALSKECK
jgi:hypothetical protein